MQIIEQPNFLIRRKTVTVTIGGIPMGSDFPVRIQSMANTQTNDITGSVEQCIRIADAGADYVRFTVPSITDADAFFEIKKELRKRGYNTPLIADVHFNPEIALKVADFADKVRINPGNFRDKDKFVSLIEKCRLLGRAIRIGVNHGSLSPAIMDKFGDTPEGMAESAMEYLRICRAHNFDQVVVSMKSSNVRVMIYATRLVAEMMDKEGMHFPLHLGVTEAGEGEDGRIKSAVGIGTLLTEGLGDTIRVSLSEAPENEIPVAGAILKNVQKLLGEGKGRDAQSETRTNYSKRKSRLTGNIGGNLPPIIHGYDQIDPGIKFIRSSINDLNKVISILKSDTNTVLVYNAPKYGTTDELKRLRTFLEQNECDAPVIIRLVPDDSSDEDITGPPVSLGSAFIDGFGDGLWLESKSGIQNEKIITTALGILQACRARMYKTEYIACPSCGRTQFDLIETLARIKKATGHLKGLKIGVMGCIVNGPGEMADADYGYVGSGRGKVTLYKAGEIIKRSIPEIEAVDALVEIIKENGDWFEP